MYYFYFTSWIYHFNLGPSWKGYYSIICGIHRVPHICSVILKQNKITLTKFSVHYRGFGISFLSSLFQIICNELVHVFKASRESIFSLVPKYLTASAKSECSRTIGSVPNIRKRGLYLECSFGKKLYAVQANGTTWFHSRDFDACLYIHVLRNYWILQFFHLTDDDKKGIKLYIPHLIV